MLAKKAKCMSMILVVSVAGSSLYGQQNTTKGAVVGGTAGAVIGGIIGHQNHETPEGALIGGAVGAIAGGVLGNAKDKQISRERYYQHQMYHQQRQIDSQQYQLAQQAQAQQAVSISDVITMSRSGLGDSVIMGHIETHGVQRRPEVSDILTLHQNGVSEGVIATMQRAPIGIPATTRYYTSSPAPVYGPPVYQGQVYYPQGSYPTSTVVVQEQVVVPQPYPVYQQGYRPTYSQPNHYSAQRYYPSNGYRRGY